MKPTRHKYEKIVYYIYGSTDKSKAKETPVLMIHGHGGDHRGLESLARELNRAIIIPDLPGFGESEEIENHTIENYVQIIKKLTVHLKCKRYIVAGHSLGSAVALKLASKDTHVKYLILMNPVPEFSKSLRNLVQTVNVIGNKIPVKYADALVKAQLYNLAAFLMHSRKRADPRHAKKYLSDQKQSHYSFKTWSESGESIYNLDQIALAKQIKVPTLIIYADTDTLTPFESIEEFTAQFSKAKLARVAKAGHFLPIEQPVMTANTISAFLGEHHI